MISTQDLPHLVGGIYRTHLQYNQNPDDFLTTSSVLGEITSKLLGSKQLTPYEAIYVGSAETYALCEPNKQNQWRTALKTVRGNTDFLDFLVKTCKPLDYHDAFYVACSSGNLLAAQWLVRSITSINNRKIIRTFDWSCSGDHIHVAMWLVRMFPDIIHIDETNTTFIGVCMRGAFKVLQWLKHINPDLNYRTMDDFAFRIACVEGHLQMARWLVRMFPDINHRAMGEDAFIMACKHGHLHVAQWLVGRFPDINYRIRDDFALYSARREGHSKVVEWLESYIGGKK